MHLDYLLQTVLLSLSSASILLIATLGLAIVFGLMGVINLAHGEFIMIGGYAALSAVRAGVPFVLAIAIATLVAGAFGALVERLIIRRLYGRLFDTMLATWGLSLALYQCAVLAFGTVTPGVAIATASVRLGAYSISLYSLSMIGVAALLFAALYLLFTRTGYGIAARAAVQDPDIARALGLQTGRLNNLTFALGSGLAGFAGAVLLPIVPATPGMGFAFVIKAFLAVVAAGPVTLAGTVVSGGALGALASASAAYWSSVAGDILFFTATIGLLVVFPRGLSAGWRIKL
jgi:urea transport system permease protein